MRDWLRRWVSGHRTKPIHPSAGPDVWASEPLRALLNIAATAVNGETGDLLEMASRQLAAAFRARYACVHLDNPGVLDPAVAGRGTLMCPVAAQSRADHERFMRAEAAYGRRARAHGACTLTEGLEDSVDLRQLAQAAGVHGGLAVPLAYQHETLGTINVYTDDPSPRIDPALLASVGAVLYGTVKRQSFVAVLERVRGTLENYLPVELVERIVREPEALASRVALKDVTVMFSDIRGFTALAENIAADVLSEMLSDHLAIMAESVFAQGGMVDKYVGDSVMAVFGAPFPQADHARRAFLTALDMQARQRELSARWSPRLDRSVEIGVGIHSGPVSIGDVGHGRRLEYAVVGDTVNVASRLRDLAGPGEILASEPATQAAGDGFALQRRGPVPVRGRSAPITVYVLTGARADAE